MKIKFYLLFVSVLFSAAFLPLQAQNFTGVIALTQRIAPWTKNKIVFHSLAKATNDRFELFTQNMQLHISATSGYANKNCTLS